MIPEKQIKNQKQIISESKELKKEKEEEENLFQNRKDILVQIDQDNKNMFYTLCETAENLEVSIDKINLELVSHKDLNIFNNKESNKQKILSKMLKIINRINNIITELDFIGKFLNNLSASNCENLQRLEKKFKYTADLAPEIIEKIQNEINKKNYKLNISILSQ